MWVLPCLVSGFFFFSIQYPKKQRFLICVFLLVSFLATILPSFIIIYPHTCVSKRNVELHKCVQSSRHCNVLAESWVRKSNSRAFCSAAGSSLSICFFIRNGMQWAPVQHGQMELSAMTEIVSLHHPCQ